MVKNYAPAKALARRLKGSGAVYNLNKLIFVPFRIQKNYLRKMGYLNRFPVDAFGAATPWFTYPALAFLSSLKCEEWQVFEYGSGYSTIYWRSRCKQTVSVEHNDEWRQKVLSMQPNADIMLATRGQDMIAPDAQPIVERFLAESFQLPDLENPDIDTHDLRSNLDYVAYATSLMSYPPGHFNVVVVDGVARSLCLYIAAHVISHDGVIILDNSDRWQYNEAQLYLVDKLGFKRIDFSGLGPINTFGWTTSMFFKTTKFFDSQRVARPVGAGDLAKYSLNGFTPLR